MFDMVKNTGPHLGYQLRITYNKNLGKYILSGHSVMISQRPNKTIEFDADGSSLVFETLEAVLNHIKNYV
jgi:hypothetical protein